MRFILSVAFAGFAAITSLDAADGPSLTVLCSNGLKAVLEELAPRFERASKTTITIKYDLAANLKRRIDGGEPFDVAVLTPTAMDDVIKAGRIRAGSRTIIAQSSLAVAVREGAAKPDIGTTDGFKRVLLGARAIAFAREGASGVGFMQAASQLGIADQVKKMPTESGEAVGTAVVTGVADLGILPISEILPVKGAEVLGPFPREVRAYVVMVGGVNASSSRASDAKRLIDFLIAPAADPIVTSKGMERVAPVGRSSWVPPNTPWGHPDLQGVYTNKDEANTPLERPDQFTGRKIEDFTAEELAAIVKQRQAAASTIAGGIGGAETGAGPTHWYDHLSARGSRPWMILDPPDGKLPPFTPQAMTREKAAAALNDARNGEGRADSWLDRSLYDRCITRGIPGSMMPVIYGNSYEIVQTPEYVAIRYEMIHETRIIPLDGRPHVGAGIRQYLGDPRGHWDGQTLVVETTNFTNKTHWGYNNRFNSEKLTLTERFTPIGPDTIDWKVTVNDPETWTRPFTFAMPLTRDASQPVFEYACHEGNLGLEHILEAARAEEKKK